MTKLVYRRCYFSRSGRRNGGVLYKGDERIGYVLEPDTYVSEEAGRRFRIPYGVYNLSPYKRQNGQLCALLSNERVSKSRSILIHGGNEEKHSLGCLLVGKKCQLSPMKEGSDILVIDRVYDCADLVKLCYRFSCDGEGATLEIIDD